MTERTIWRWKSEGKVPKAAVLALYWESQYGRSLINTDHHNETVLLRARIRILEEQFIRAKEIITGMKLLNYGTANQPLFDEEGEFNVHNPTTDLAASVPAKDAFGSATSVPDQGQPDVSSVQQSRMAAA